MISIVLGDRQVRGIPRVAYTDANESAYISPVGSGEIVPVKSQSHKFWKPDFLADGRMTMFIAGVPKAGKSFLAKEMINTLPKDYDILLFTGLSENDGNFKEFSKRLYKIRMEPDNLSRMTLEAIRSASKHPILLFDDIDYIRDKEVRDLTYAILEDALANGRGHEKHDGVGDIHVIVTSHALNNYKQTKYSLENSEYVALFPASTTYCQLRRMFEKVGLGKDMCEMMTRLARKGDFRYMIVHKTAPVFVLFGDSIMLC